MPFTYYECAGMLKGFTDKEKITLYGVSGGIPEYLSHINNSLSLAKNLEELFLILRGASLRSLPTCSNRNSKSPGLTTASSPP
jgi:hypothetical protein